MRILLVWLLILGTTRGQGDEPRGRRVTCEGGIPARETEDSFCCTLNNLDYCCKKQDPLMCFTLKLGGGGTGGGLEGFGEHIPDQHVPDQHKEECKEPKILRTAMSTLRALGKALKLCTLTFTQSEGCDETEMSIAWAGLDPGRDYEILFGENIACGSKVDDAEVIARMEVTARAGNVQIPSQVKSLRDMKGKQVILKFADEDPSTFACGTLTVF